MASADEVKKRVSWENVWGNGGYRQYARERFQQIQNFPNQRPVCDELDATSATTDFKSANRVTVFTTVDKAAHAFAGVCRKYDCEQVKKELNSELFEEQENQQWETRGQHVERIAAKQVVYLDDNLIKSTVCTYSDKGT